MAPLSPDETDRIRMPEPGNKFSPLPGGIVFIATILALVGIILAVSGYYDRVREQQMFVKVLEPKSEELVNLRAREDTRLGAYKYADRGKGTVALPIARAMELLLQESATGKPFYPGQPTPVKILEPEKGPEKGNVAPAKAN